MGIFALALCFLASVLMSACGGDPFWLPRAHKITIQQGNLISQTQLERVTVGMNRDEVRLYLHSRARWFGNSSKTRQYFVPR